jgi:hypothetical protein
MNIEDPEQLLDNENDSDGFVEQSVSITAREAETIVHSYLSDLASIDENWELGGSTGGWEIRWKRYALERIDHLLAWGAVSESRVRQMAIDAFKPLNDVLNERANRLKEIASAVGGVVEGHQGKLDDLVFELGGEMHAPDGKFLVHLVGSDSSPSNLCGTVADAAEWLLKLHHENMTRVLQ